jgi:hypothetical protein
MRPTQLTLALEASASHGPDGGVLRRFALLAALTAAVTLAGPAAATIRLVPSSYPTIQSAIDASVDGDEVRVAPGLYQGAGNVWIDIQGKEIAVVSEGGLEVTTIDGENAAPAFHLLGGDTHQSRIEGFTIINGNQQAGGGIYCHTNSPTIRNCVFRNCHAVDGGGIYLEYSSSLIENCAFIDCDAGGGAYGGSGGGLCVEQATPTITDCLFENNTAGGVQAYGSGNGGGAEAMYATFIRCRFYGNTATMFGGGVDLSSGLLQDCIVVGNRSGWGGGCASAQSVIEGCTIAGNEALTGPQGYAQGGGVLVHSGNSTIRRTVVWGNCADAEGDQIYARLSFVATLDCICTDPAGLEGNWTDLGNNVFADPLFCGALPCGPQSVGGMYTLHTDSPCLPAHSPCGQRIGALDWGCGPPTPVRSSSWGRIKSMYK